MKRSFDHEYFDSGEEVPGGYSSYTESVFLPLFARLAGRFATRYAPSTVLDVGCAKGYLVTAFRDAGLECFGVDVSAYALEAAPARVRPYLWCADLTSEPLPFEEARFDLVTALGPLEYMTDHRPALGEIRRVTRPGGIFFMTALLGRQAGDAYRVNVHGERFWRAEVEAAGFRFLPGDTRAVYRDHVEDEIRRWREGLRRRSAELRVQNEECGFEAPPTHDRPASFRARIALMVAGIPWLGRSALAAYKRAKVGMLVFERAR